MLDYVVRQVRLPEPEHPKCAAFRRSCSPCSFNKKYATRKCSSSVPRVAPSDAPDFRASELVANWAERRYRVRTERHGCR